MAGCDSADMMWTDEGVLCPGSRRGPRAGCGDLDVGELGEPTSSHKLLLPSQHKQTRRAPAHFAQEDGPSYAKYPASKFSWISI